MTNKGFTIIELLLYLSLLIVVLFLASGFLWNVIFGEVKQISYQEIKQNADFALTKIEREIKKAIGINSPLPGSSANVLSLAMADSKLNPTTFEVLDGKLKMKQGNSPYFDLTSNQVIVENLTFTNLSYNDTPGTIEIKLTLARVNPKNRKEYLAKFTLKTTASLLPGGAGDISPPKIVQLRYRWRNDDGTE